eukprot:GGOE01065348.1.p1 GENE.GGOE01065348.1~~GGOE01065348.1.p1  ORF type:complete len:336 (+),score=96.36 GGOE01065348.1:45-1010(+)
MSSSRTAFSITINIIAAVSVILVNKKAVFDIAKFHFGTALTMMHFVWTWILCLILCGTGLFERKRLDMMEIFKISVVFSSYLLFQNLSLVYNSVGFYQIMKIANTPAILIMEYFLYGKRQHPRVLWALVVVCTGIGAAVFTEPKLNFIGAIHATLAVMFNSLYTIWGKHKQVELQCNSPQLLLYQAPVAAGLLLFPLVFDDMQGFLSYEFTPTSLVCIASSCLLAGLVNLSFFWMVARTNPITANVVGYLKTVFVFLGGFVLFADALTLQNLIGITITLLGSAIFMWSQMQDTKEGEEPEDTQSKLAAGEEGSQKCQVSRN